MGIRQAAEFSANTIRARQVDPSGTCCNQTQSHRESGTEIGADVVFVRDPAQDCIIRNDSGRHTQREREHFRAMHKRWRKFQSLKNIKQL